MKYCVILILWIFNICFSSVCLADESENIINKYNFIYYCENDIECFSENEIETAINLVYQEIKNTFGKEKQSSTSRLFSVEIVVVPSRQKRIYCQPFISKYEWCLGLTVPHEENNKTSFTTYFVKRSLCIGKTSLVHELFHVFGFILYRNADADHENKTIWGEKGCVSKINNKLKKLFCK